MAINRIEGESGFWAYALWSIVAATGYVELTDEDDERTPLTAAQENERKLILDAWIKQQAVNADAMQEAETARLDRARARVSASAEKLKGLIAETQVRLERAHFNLRLGTEAAAYRGQLERLKHELASAEKFLNPPEPWSLRGLKRVWDEAASSVSKRARSSEPAPALAAPAPAVRTARDKQDERDLAALAERERARRLALEREEDEAKAKARAPSSSSSSSEEDEEEDENDEVSG